jgi:hypothetical protein
MDYFINLDIADLWIEKISPFYDSKIKISNPDEYKRILGFIEQINKFCLVYMENFLSKVDILNDEKIENETLLNITIDTISFISSSILYYNEYASLQTMSKLDLSPKNFITKLVQKIEEKSNTLLKKYPPLTLNALYYL